MVFYNSFLIQSCKWKGPTFILHHRICTKESGCQFSSPLNFTPWISTTFYFFSVILHVTVYRWNVFLTIKKKKIVPSPYCIIGTKKNRNKIEIQIPFLPAYHIFSVYIPAEFVDFFPIFSALFYFVSLFFSSSCVIYRGKFSPLIEIFVQARYDRHCSCHAIPSNELR